MHVQLVARVALLDNLKAEADSWPILTDRVVRVRQVVVQKLGVVEFAESEVVEHIWCEFILLGEDELELSQELDFDLAAATFDVSDLSNVSCIRDKLGLVAIQRVPPRRVLVTVLGVEKLRVSLIEVISQVVLRDVRKVQKFQQLNWLLLDQVVFDAEFLGDWVLRARIVQKLLFWNCLRCLIDLVEAEKSHDQGWDSQLEERAEPRSPPVDAILAG